MTSLAAARRRASATYPAERSNPVTIAPCVRDHDRSHAVPATVVENALAAQCTQLLHGGPNPRFVIEIVGIVEPQRGDVGESRFTIRRLMVVKKLLGLQTRKCDHSGGRGTCNDHP